AAVSYGGTNFRDVAFSLEKNDKGFGGQINLKAPGGTALDVNSTIAFAAQTRSPQDGSVTYSDPAVTLETKLASTEPLKLAEIFLKDPSDKNIVYLLDNNLASESQLTIRPKQIDITAAFVKLAETRVNASGTYRLGAG